MLRALSSFSRWNRRSTLSGPSNLRVEVCPPSLRCAPDGNTWQRLMFWLMAPAPRHAAPPAVILVSIL